MGLTPLALALALMLSPVHASDRDSDRASRASRGYFAALPKVWQKLAFCESSSTIAKLNLRAKSPSGQHVGVWQLHKGFYKAQGVDWRTATIQQQWQVAQYVYSRQGARAWTCARKAGLK